MFLTFEGLDGSGKTTQVELLTRHLEEAGREVVVTREPGGTDLGERIRELLLHGPDMSAWAEATLFAAARAELVERVICLRASAARTCSVTVTSTPRSPTRGSRAGSAWRPCSSSTWRPCRA